MLSDLAIGLTSPHSFNLGNQPMYAVGMVRQAVEDGCEAINAVIVEGADAIFRAQWKMPCLPMALSSTM